MQRLIAITLLAGSILFIVGAALPISAVYMERNTERASEFLNTHLTQWRISQALMGLGGLVTALSIILAATHFRTPWFIVAGTAVLIGALLWDWHVALRAANPDMFAARTLPAWHFLSYSLLTILALMLTGIGFLQGGYPRWLGILNIVTGVLFAAAWLIFRDLPPGVYYLVFLVNGIALLLLPQPLT
jgi:hypothetical protein